MPVLFWLTTVARYVLSGFVAFLLAIAISFAVILPFAKDSSPGVGFLWFMVFIPVASLVIERAFLEEVHQVADGQ